ncbi:MAG: ATP-dependent zinc protease family protein, partial [Thermoanaerobaculia bacterium]
LGVERIKVKVDTGARTSALHAYRIRGFRRDGEDWVRFQIHPIQRDAHTTIEAEAPVLTRRRVRSSSGHERLRPVIRTSIELGGERWPIELSLVRRDMMGFRMLLGRGAVRRRFLVDVGGSFLASSTRQPKED